MRIQEIKSSLSQQLEHCMKTNMKQIAPVYITSKPGVGKSQMIQQIADEYKIKLNDARLAQFAPEDLRGVPYPNVKEKSTEWFAPAFLPRADEWNILFLDELDKAKPAVQNAALQLFLDRKLGEYVLPYKTFITAAGNTIDDNSFSVPLSSALNNRMMHIELEPDVRDWIKWASTSTETEKKSIHRIEEDIIGFIQFKPNMLHEFSEKERAWPSPRTWEMFSECIRSKEKPKDIDIINFGTMTIGKNPSREFHAYRKIYKDIDPKDILKGNYPNLDNKEASFKYAISTCIGFFVKNNGLKNKEEAKNCLNFIIKFSDEFKLISLKLMLARNQLNNKLSEWCKDELNTALSGIFDKIMDN